MEQECRGNKLAVTDLVGDDSTNNDAETKASKTGPVYKSNFQTGKVKGLHPIAKDSPANRETHTGSKDCHESCKQQTLCVWRDCLITDLNVAHRFRWEVADGVCS